MRKWLGRNDQLYILSLNQELNTMLVEPFNQKLQCKNLFRWQTISTHYVKIVVNLFHTNVSFLYPRKRQKTRRFLTFSGGTEMEQCCEIAKILQEAPVTFLRHLEQVFYHELFRKDTTI